MAVEMLSRPTELIPDNVLPFRKPEIEDSDKDAVYTQIVLFPDYFPANSGIWGKNIPFITGDVVSSAQRRTPGFEQFHGNVAGLIKSIRRSVELDREVKIDPLSHIECYHCRRQTQSSYINGYTPLSHNGETLDTL